jgi:energy-converting hydrogenase Eha subunit A
MGDFSIAVLCLAGCVFAASAGVKLRDRQAYRSFREGLRETALVPGSLLSATAAALCGAEAVIAVSLLTVAVLTAAAVTGTKPLAESVLAAAAALTVVLAVGVAAVIRRGTVARCSCFGAGSSRPLGWAHLVRNLSLLTVICAGLAAVPLARGYPALAGAALAAGAGAMAALLFVRWDELVELFAPVPRSVVVPPPVRRPGRKHH